MKKRALSRVTGFGLVVAFSGMACASLVGANFDNKVLCSGDCPDSVDGSDSGSEDATNGDETVEVGPGHYGLAPDGDGADAGNPNSVPPPAPVLVSNAASIAAGGAAACAVLSTGTVTCWRDTGLPGTGAPTAVAGLTNVTAVSIGSDPHGNTHLCALLSDGTVSCWGSNVDGELGNGNPGGQSSIPMTVPNVAGATAIAAGGGFTCAIVSGGTVMCWGNLSHAQAVEGGTGVAGPTVVSGLSNAVSIAAGVSAVCAVLADGSVSCWGDNSSGELGNGESGNRSLTPVKVVGLNSASGIVVGDTFSCALLSSDSVQCWGSPMAQAGDGILGNGTTLSSTIPVAVTNLVGVAKIAAGDGFACTALSNGTVECWGDNGEGQIGNGTMTTSAPYGVLAPSIVSNLSNVTDVAAGDGFGCALIAGGAVDCWGQNANCAPSTCYNNCVDNCGNACGGSSCTPCVPTTCNSFCVDNCGNFCSSDACQI